MKKCLFEKEKKCYFCCCCSCHLGERLECLHFYPSKPQAPPEGQQLHLRERVKWKSERVARMNERKRQGDRRSRTRREKVVPYTADITAAMAQTYLYKVKKEEPEKRKKKSHVLRDKFNTLRLLGFTWVTNHRPAEHIFGRHAVCQGSQWVRGQGSWVISGGGGLGGCAPLLLMGWRHKEMAPHHQGRRTRHPTLPLPPPGGHPVRRLQSQGSQNCERRFPSRPRLVLRSGRRMVSSLRPSTPWKNSHEFRRAVVPAGTVLFLLHSAPFGQNPRPKKKYATDWSWCQTSGVVC